MDTIVRNSLPHDKLKKIHIEEFTFSAVDYFGPFYIKEGWKELKRYQGLKLTVTR